MSGHLDPVHRGHADVHHHDVRREAAVLLDGVATVDRLADDLDIVLGIEGQGGTRRGFRAPGRRI